MLSVFDIFKVGIGPSSSHTVGPMRAALMFARALDAEGLLAATAGVRVRLYGSLGATGHGHATDVGAILGLLGEAPDTVDPATVRPRLDAMRRSGRLALLDRHAIDFEIGRDIAFVGHESLAEHPNGMRMLALDATGAVLADRCYFSVGGGFVVEGGAAAAPAEAAAGLGWPHPFRTATNSSRAPGSRA